MRRRFRELVDPVARPRLGSILELQERGGSSSMKDSNPYSRYYGRDYTDCQTRRRLDQGSEAGPSLRRPQLTEAVSTPDLASYLDYTRMDITTRDYLTLK